MAAPRRLAMRCFAAVALSWLAMQAHAAQVLTVRVTRTGAHFVIGMHIAIDAPPAAVFRALQDYPAMMRFNPDLRAVRVQPTGTAGSVRLFTTIHVCVLVFCKTLHQEQLMTAVAGADGGLLEAELLPHGGDFKEGHARWTVTSCDGAGSTACLDVRIELYPAFWVPPVIGPWALRRRMTEEARRTSKGLEVIARASRPGAARTSMQSIYCNEINKLNEPSLDAHPKIASAGGRYPDTASRGGTGGFAGPGPLIPEKMGAGQ